MFTKILNWFQSIMKHDDIDEDKEQRTTDIGLFYFADSYWAAASALAKLNLKTRHADSPVQFLYYHAIELYLKSFLRIHGHTVAELTSRKFGHSTRRLRNRSQKLGLVLDDEDVEILSLMAKTDVVIRSRYIQTGFGRFPTSEGLDRTCKSIRRSVAAALTKRGIPAHLLEV